ncbi:ABC transporter ATP-binding protein [Rhodococcus rhodnii]|uniref:Bifunctional ABC lipid A exporter n=2 Tax=Rhodococcus rhodnii TaxID=38312 RepID=R7WQK3_9NOCA|nr:ABC transporter ATP-binding protein [Rhodococcus rhodnii]EOM77601.1 bifunctional ABC lipid A exporter [Rhodococcus rhodnii LMG 5362]TXG90225.1 ABC transporter ATP-binding protein [Rhodococcus rhodnii]
MELVRPHRKVVAVGLLLGLAGSFGALAQPMAARVILDAVAAGTGFLAPLSVLIALLVAGSVMSGAQMFLLERAGERIVLGLRLRLVRRLLHLRVQEYDRRQTGDLLSKAGSDTTLLRSVLTAGVLDAVPGIVTVIGAIGLMAYLDWILLVVVLGVMLAVMLVVAPALARIKDATHSAQDHVGLMTSALERALGAVRTVKAGGMQDTEADLIGSHAENAYAAGIRTARLDTLVGVGTGVALELSFLAVMGVGGYRVASGALPAADLIAFLLYVMYLASPILVITVAVTQLQKAFAALARIAEADDMETEFPDVTTVNTPAPTPPRASRHQGSAAEDTPQTPPEVEFDQVTFAYRTGEPVLKNVSFRISPGSRTAVVGPSGVGKTTVLNLLERFYTPTSGRVLLDGRDIATIPLDRLRARIGYVEQGAPVLDGTLRENLVYGIRREVSERELLRVVRAVRLDEVIAGLGEGLNSPVGERGSQLSGGERQRVAAARLLLRRPGLVLLDEATSQLDSLNESAVHEAFDDATAHATTIVVAHRLSTVVSADRIMVLEGGGVRAVGTHAELMATDDFYQDLARGQLLPQH